MLDTAGTGDTEGQGYYLANIDGVLLEECFWHNIGISPVKIYTHGAYIAAGCRRVVVRKCFGSDIEHAFIQARGSAWKDGQADDGDPGPLMEDCISNDAAVAYMPNGRRATMRRVITLAGHHTETPNTLGSCALWGSVAEMKAEDCILLRSPVKGNGYTENWHNGPRRAGEFPGAYTGVCRLDTPNNVTRLDVVVDLSDLVTRARAGEPIGPLVGEAQARCRKAVA